MSSTPKATHSRSPKPGGKMTRAVVANLNRQRAASSDGHDAAPPNGPSSGADGMTPTSSPSNSPSRNNNNSSSPQKSLPPQPSGLRKELPDIPEFFVVRPRPKSSTVKAERNDRRVFLNTATLQKIKISNGSVVLIQPHYPRKDLFTTKRSDSSQSGGDSSSDEEEKIDRSTVGIACPLSRIEPNGINATLGDF
jgi:hypothetical protein